MKGHDQRWHRDRRRDYGDHGYRRWALDVIAAMSEWIRDLNDVWEDCPASQRLAYARIFAELCAQLEGLGQVHIEADRFRRERDVIAEMIETHGFNRELGSYVGELDGDRVDASLLLMGCLGYQVPDHPRMRTTFNLIQNRLGNNGLLYRYEKGFDGLQSREGAFGMCSFWAIDNLAQRGDVEAGARSFEHILSFSNDLGLFAEEIDVESGAALGNFPQAFTHVGLINAATALATAAASRN